MSYIVGSTYEVGAIVRAMNEYYLKPTPNLATRANMLDLLGRLDAFTEQLAPFTHLATSDNRVSLAMDGWQARLQGYVDAAEAAPEGHSQDLAELVVAPLILGWYPGSDIQQTADVATPFSIANQVAVTHQFRQENLRRFGKDLGERAAIAGTGIGAGLLGAAIGLAILWLRPWKWF